MPEKEENPTLPQEVEPTLEPIWDPNSTPPTGPMEPLPMERIQEIETYNVPIVDPAVPPSAPPSSI